MKHFLQTNRSKANELIAKFERLNKKGDRFSLEENEYLSILDHYEFENNLDNALAAIDLALNEYRESGLLHLRKAKLLLYLRDIDKAFESLNRAEIFGHSNFEISLMRVRAYCYQKEYDVARELLQNMKVHWFHIPEKISEVYTLEAFMYERQEDYTQMFEALKEAILENPKNKEALGRIYLCVELSHRYPESAELHKQILEIEPYSYMAWFNLAHAYFAIGEYKKALDAFDYAIITNENFELAYLDYAELCYSLHMWDKALSLYVKLTQLIEPDEELLCRIGECLENLGAYEKARVYLYRALAINPKFSDTYYHIGQCYALEGSWGSALHFYKQAVKLDSEREDYLSALAKNHQMLGFPQRAIPFYKKAIEIGPELGVNWAELTQILIHDNKIEEALQLVEDAFEYTYDTSLFYCKAACLYKQKEIVAMMDTLKEALLENHEEHTLLFEICPALKEDRGVLAIIRYYDPKFFDA